ncbi:MAG: DUF2927 domain-containing protein [Pseudomonadota bacterium]
MRFVLTLFAFLALVVVPINQPTSAPRFSDGELIDGFMQTVFGSENFWVSAAAKHRVSKFTGPVRVHVVDMAGSRRSGTVRKFVRDLNRRIANLQMVSVKSSTSANYTVFLVRRSDYASVIRGVLPNVRTRFLEQAACSGIAFLESGGGITEAMAFVVADEGRHMFQHCMVEEILQGLGPSNDSPKLVHSIFNDRNGIDTFTVFDRYIMNMLYHPAIRPGMTRNQVRRVLPGVVQDVRRTLG